MSADLTHESTDELTVQAPMGPTRPISLDRLAWKVSQHERRSFWAGFIGFVIFFSLPALSGWLLGRGFAALADGDSAAVYRFAIALAVADVARMAAIHIAAIKFTKSWVHMQTFLRANLLKAQMVSGGPEAGQPVGSAGEAVTHFRDDAEDVAEFVDGVVDVGGGAVFVTIAGTVLGMADARAALVLLGPLVAVVLVTRVLDSRIKEYRAADRAATAAVTGLVGDTMAAATTLKVNGAAEHILARLRTLVGRRGETAVRDRFLTEGVMAFSQGAADVGFGLVLIVSAAAIASGSFGIGTLALFAAYLGWLSFLPRMIGRLLARRKQAFVAVERMRLLVAESDARNTVRPRDLPLEPWQQGVRFAPQRPARQRLEQLDAVDLTARYPNGAGVGPLSFSVARGSFTVITGPVGAGKSTFLRALLGLAWNADVNGEVRWNGETLADRAAFLVPPNAAFLPHVPQLVSDTVSENVALGLVDEMAVETALELAALAADVATMPAGSATMIGPRGLRLSGGQRQRLATARALVHSPELVVLDDLSSAVDVETELRLWDNLTGAGLTVIAVSHRAVAFDRADQIIRLDG
ncbi:ABC transporter ATP-binding protein [soil metagenome]